jgi:hypothetical protein
VSVHVLGSPPRTFCERKNELTPASWFDTSADGVKVGMAATTTYPLVGTRAKIKRAKKHIEDLQAELIAFDETDPYLVRAENDPQTGELVYRVVKATPVPIAVSILAGDAIQNLRSALDHLAYQLVYAAVGGVPSNFKHIYFPILKGKRDKAACEGKIKGAMDAVLEAILAMEPYEGGKGHEFWILDGLNNTDKHRLLLTVGCAYLQQTLGAAWSPSYQNMTVMVDDVGYDVTTNPIHPLLNVPFDLNDPIFPLETGSVLRRNPPRSKPNPYATFRFVVVVAEPEAPNGEPILRLLDRLTTRVERTVSDLEPYL